MPPTNDETSFLRALSRALGLACGTAFKATQLRDRVEEFLQAGDLMLVMGEAHYCFPVRNQRKGMPHRINWMLTQRSNFGVPVALLTTPQFTKSQETLVKNGGWSSEQLIGRTAHYEQLPECLSESDLTAVARACFPKGDAASISLVVTYARGSEKYLAGIESVARRAHFVANQAGRDCPALTGDVRL